MKPESAPHSRKPVTVRLFVKPFCPWCEEAVDWLDEHGIKYETLDVIRDAVAYREMVDLTDQDRAPCIEVDGEVLADFGVDELQRWLAEHGYEV
ncbi:MAG: glutaredoxin family protein [Verrucomicrobia bacterium]|nr:MAG: glutaredoxin family protein [Verrucomicrobiota bacterium]